MKTIELDAPCAGALNTLTAVIQMYCSAPIVFRKIVFRTLDGKSASACIEFELECYTQLPRGNRVLVCFGVIQVGNFYADAWSAHAGPQSFKANVAEVEFSRISASDEMIQKFSLKTLTGKRATGSNIHDYVITD